MGREETRSGRAQRQYKCFFFQKQRGPRLCGNAGLKNRRSLHDDVQFMMYVAKERTRLSIFFFVVVLEGNSRCIFQSTIERERSPKAKKDYTIVLLPKYNRKYYIVRLMTLYFAILGLNFSELVTV